MVLQTVTIKRKIRKFLTNIRGRPHLTCTAKTECVCRVPTDTSLLPFYGSLTRPNLSVVVVVEGSRRKRGTLSGVHSVGQWVGSCHDVAAQAGTPRLRG